jgi:hypothetical protein
MHVQSIPGFLKALGITAVLLVLLVTYGHLSFYRDPGSIFFDRQRATERHYGSYREKEAAAFATAAKRALNSSSTHAAAAAAAAAATLHHRGPNPSLCAVIVTVARDATADGKHPLELAVASALAGLDERERRDLDLRVYFANSRPAEHPLWKSAWLAALVDETIEAERNVLPAQF